MMDEPFSELPTHYWNCFDLADSMMRSVSMAYDAATLRFSRNMSGHEQSSRTFLLLLKGQTTI